MNPTMELLWLIVGSAAMWHMKNKFLGGSSTEETSAPKDKEFFDNVHDIKPPPGGKVPFSRPGNGQMDSFNIGSLLKLFAR
jgi:hypothetical protein